MSSKLKFNITHLFHVVLLLLLHSPYTQADGTNAQTISKLDGFGNQRPCGQGCFYNANLCDRIGGVLGCISVCGSASAQEQCYCRPDLQPIASSFITDCIKTSCQPAGQITLDIQAAINFYSGYCSAAGYQALTTTAKVTTTSATTMNVGTTSAAPSSTSELSKPTVTSSTSEISKPTATSTTSSQGSSSYIISTVPPATTTKAITDTSTQPVTVTKVFVSKTSTSSTLNAQPRLVMLVAFFFGVCFWEI